MNNPLLFGVGTADHQCEAFDPNYPDIRDQWEQKPDQTPRGRATDFWNRYPEDVKLAAGLGCKLFRFSVAWSRVEPEPGVFSEESLAHYGELVDAIVAAGMEPMLTVHHYVWPLWLEDQGGLLGAGFPEAYRRYTDCLAGALGDRVRYWITLNEPNILAYGYLKAPYQEDYRMPPGLSSGATIHDSMRACATLARNLFLANAAGYDAIHAHRPDAMVSANPLIVGLPRWIRSIADWRTTRLRNPEGLVDPGFLISAIDPLGVMRRALSQPMERLLSQMPMITTADWWHLGISGQLKDFFCPAECQGKQDYVGFDYYWGTQHARAHRIQSLLGAGEGHFDQAPVWPGAIGQMARKLARMFPKQSVMVIENGCVPEADGRSRGEYIEQHVRVLEAARQAGCPVIGYVCWSITSNREWGLPAGPACDFGLYYVDLDGDPQLTRQPTPAAEHYKRLITELGG